MAKGSIGKLTKLKSVLKRLNSFNSKQRCSSESFTEITTVNSEDLHPVYVGKSRRKYLVRSNIIDHPLFRELAERSSIDSDYDDHPISIACEVVLFEHLLWILENAADDTHAAGSLDELVEFYAC